MKVVLRHCLPNSTTAPLFAVRGGKQCRATVELFARCKEIQITESERFLLVESGIQLKQSGIRLTIGIRNPSSTHKDWNPVPGIRNPWCGI